MGKYTPEEIRVFEDKELRIVRQAIIKKLIEKCKLEDVYGVNKVTELTEKYVDYVYEERSTKGGKVGCATDSTEHIPNWEQLATGLNLAIPTSQNVKILNQILDEYKQAYKASANPKDVLTCCMDRFGAYPKETGSVKKVIKSLIEI